MARLLVTPVALIVPSDQSLVIEAVVDTGSDLHRIDGVVARGGGGRLQRVAEGVGQIPGGGFETGGVEVGNVIANDVHLFLVSIQAADG